MNDWIRLLIRLVVSAIVLMVTAAVVPGFRSLTFMHALLAAIAIAAVSYLIEAIVGKNISPYGRGVVSFIVSALVIYLVQFIVPGLSVSVFGALLGALVIGIIDLFVPTTLR
jgi:putative membrane protein